MSTKTSRSAKAAKKTSGSPQPNLRGERRGGVAKKSYSIPLSAVGHAEKLAEARGISTSALVGRAIEEMYERAQRIERAHDIAQELLAESVEVHGAVTDEDESAVDAFLAEVKMAGA